MMPFLNIFQKHTKTSIQPSNYHRRIWGGFENYLLFLIILVTCRNYSVIFVDTLDRYVFFGEGGGFNPYEVRDHILIFSKS